MNKFRNASGTRYLNSLFYEQTGTDKSSVVYTLKDEDYLGFPSLYKLYITLSDPTEYKFAQKHLDGWAHWEALLGCSWFQDIVIRWRAELSAKIASQAYLRIKDIADGGGKEALTANRYLLERAEKAAHAKNRGRPTKDAIEDKTHQRALELQQTASDFKRLNFTPN